MKKNINYESKKDEFKRILMITVLSILGFILLIVLLGVYKFNFTNDDIYTTNDQGEIVPIDEVEKTN